jgi:hypothetical protein
MITHGDFDYNSLESLRVLLPHAVHGFILPCESKVTELLILYNGYKDV